MANLAVWIPRLFLISAFIASLTCFARPDFNLPLFIFAYMAWGLQRVKIPVQNSSLLTIFPRVKNQESPGPWPSLSLLI